MHGSRYIGIFSLIALKWPHLSKNTVKRSTLIIVTSDNLIEDARTTINFQNGLNLMFDCLRLEGDKRVTKDLRLRARGPSKVASSFSKLVINEFRFRTKDLDKKSKTQNSGVVVTAKTSNFASTKDMNPVIGGITYYGVLIDIIQLDYYEE